MLALGCGIKFDSEYTKWKTPLPTLPEVPGAVDSLVLSTLWVLQYSLVALSFPSAGLEVSFLKPN